MLQAPEGANIGGDEYATERLVAETILRDIKTDSTSGVLLPHGWNLSLLSASGKKQFDTNAVIERYDNRIAMTMLADFIMLGHEQVGAFVKDLTAVGALTIDEGLEDYLRRSANLPPKDEESYGFGDSPSDSQDMEEDFQDIEDEIS